MEEKYFSDYGTSRSELLVQCGFIKGKTKDEDYTYNSEKDAFERKDGKPVKASDAEEEESEWSHPGGKYAKTGYPKPLKSYWLTYEAYDLSLEEPYFWVLEGFKQSFPIVDKIEDSFAASENSAFFGVTQQRLAAQQDRISQFLATVGKMIKELFQMVRELRILQERLGYYTLVAEQEGKELAQREKGPEMVLKGMFVDLVQGGGKSAASVYGMARELEFITLPDLFFDAPPFKNHGEVEKYVNSLEKDFNRNVTRVLLRHLTQYVEWRHRTYKEHEDRKRFMLQYLLQHYEIIRMYIQWIKPYLRNVPKLSMKQKSLTSPELLSAFEGSMLDVEILGRTEPKEVTKSGTKINMYGCVLATFHYRTRPELKVVQEGYNRGPVHIGKMDMQLRGYVWTEEELRNYLKVKDKEMWLLLGDLTGTVVGAMNALGDELDKYLVEARQQKKGEKKEEKKDGGKKQKSFMESFLGEFYQAPEKSSGPVKKSARDAWKESKDLDAARGGLAGGVRGVAWNTYNNFKKAHRMITW